MVDAKFIYAALRNRGVTRRFLFCKTEEIPHFGHNTFDFLFFFGFGTGEYTGLYPMEYDIIRVRRKLLDANAPDGFNESYISELFKRPTDGFVGFMTNKDGEYTVLEYDPEGIPISHIPEFHWPYYTQLGDKDRAYSAIQTMKKRHVLFDTLQEQNDVMERYARLAVAI
jgi:hypothetical protein